MSNPDAPTPLRAVPGHAASGCRKEAVQALLGPAPFAAVVIQPADGRICYGNHQALALLGYGRAELDGMPLTRIVPSKQLAAVLHRFALGNGGDEPATTATLVRRDGSTMEVHLTAYRIDLERPYWIGIAREVRACGAAEHSAQLDGLFQLSHEGIAICDDSLAIRHVNDAFCQITGWSAAQLHGRTPHEALRPDFGQLVVHRDPWAQRDSAAWQGEVNLRRSDGLRFPAWVRINRVGSGEQSRVVTLLHDLSEKRAAERRIHQLANYDVLTDLPNRLLFNEFLSRAMERARRSGGKAGLIFLDLDRFKDVNDALGHTLGNRLLRLAAERLRRAVRDQDTVARLGGDEFGVILENLQSPHAAAQVVRKLLDALHVPFSLDGADVVVGASAGIAVFPDDGRDIDSLLKNADTAMYQAKAEGRDGYHFYTPELTRATVERFHLERQLRRALENDELTVHYQPQAAADNGRIVGVEALVRWRHPEHGFIPPGRFIPVAEETGLISALGEWVLFTACRQAGAWERSPIGPLRLAVNLSGRQIRDRGVVAKVRQALDASGLSPERLELEVTEGFLIHNPRQGGDVLKALKALGTSIAMDDFGTGYSSLSYLKHFPVDRIKIDQSFVRDLPADKDSAAITSTVIAIARTLGLTVIAEGVETREQLHYLQREGCNEVQGYYLSRPQPAADLEAFLRRAQRLTPARAPAETWKVLASLR